MSDIKIKDRAEWAKDTLDHFSRFGGNDSNETFTLTVDLLANLQHLCDREETDWLEALRLSTVHYEAEFEEAKEVEEATEEQEIASFAFVRSVGELILEKEGQRPTAADYTLRNLITKAKEILKGD